MFKYLLAGLLLFPIAAESQTKKSDIDRAKLAAMGFSPMPVGSIVQSLLTEAQFQGENGVGWVLMTGQAIAGSKLCTKHSLCSLPDARGQFLRTAGGSAAALRALQAQATKLNGISLSTGGASLTGSVAGGTASLTGSVAGGTASGSFAPANHTHTHEHQHLWWQSDGTFNSSGWYLSIAGVNASTSGGAYVIPTGTEARYTSLGGSNPTSASGSASVSSTAASNGNLGVSSTAANNGTLGVSYTAQALQNDGVETRPINLTVNTFIKIN